MAPCKTSGANFTPYGMQGRRFGQTSGAEVEGDGLYQMPSLVHVPLYI